MLTQYGIDSRTFKKAALYGAGALTWSLILWRALG